ncbi:MAG: rRNA methyltransferase [Gammaproteobacteria bacterium]|nr:rRNA methyltransferase [Gammaproteobacteria bacterium]MBJ55743.1 rRNA methyltransferase [Gammaproteobacteria bacterium]HBN16124.1 hypothetical protein [Pseudohongiella sp.]|tara:strand:+ start:32 stop:1081 length:1050 start_codon:yes stop_codon:yes gene_type:complete
MKDASLDQLMLVLSNALQNREQVLWVADENLSPEVMMQLRSDTALTAMTNRIDVADKLKGLGVAVCASDFNFDGLGNFDRIVYRLSKEKAIVHHVINQSLQHLTEQGVLTLIGGKQDGIKSIVKNASDTYGLNAKAKKQGITYVAELPAPNVDVPADTALPDSNYANLRQISVGGEKFWTKPGIFGWDKVDRGSQLLAESLPGVCQYIKSVDSILDLGCGWGYLMLQTKLLEAARRVATDNNVAAVLSAEKNFAEAGMKVLSLVDDCGASLQERFDLIVCNPPFHQGFSQGEAVTLKFLQAARRLSRRSTRAVFVVNQFIPLDRLGAQYFSRIQAVASNNGFTVYELRP